METKEKIITESMNLFSIKGYEGVSMRDIAASVGIRQSSIYKHFQSKQDILDTLVLNCKNKISAMYEYLNVPGGENADNLDKYSNMDIEDLKKICINMFLLQMKDDTIVKFKRILSIEQYNNEELQKIYQELFMHKPLNYQAKVFEYLIQCNIFKATDSKVLAIEFFSPFYMLSNLYINDNNMLQHMLEKHIEHFIHTNIREELM